jgi:predicted transcriptional regulator
MRTNKSSLKGGNKMMGDDSVMENENRRMIYNHITAHPGVSFSVLKKVFNLNDSTLRYHLNYLEKNEKISLGLESGTRQYYPYMENNHVTLDQEESNGEMIPELSDIQERIIEVIKKYPKINQKELGHKTRINRITLSRNLKTLINLCIVRKMPNGNKVIYEYIAFSKLRYEILKRLLIKLINNEIDEGTFLKLKRKLD